MSVVNGVNRAHLFQFKVPANFYRDVSLGLQHRLLFPVAFYCGQLKPEGMSYISFSRGLRF